MTTLSGLIVDLFLCIILYHVVGWINWRRCWSSRIFRVCVIGQRSKCLSSE